MFFVKKKNGDNSSEFDDEEPSPSDTLIHHRVVYGPESSPSFIVRKPSQKRMTGSFNRVQSKHSYSLHLAKTFNRWRLIKS